MDGSSTAAVQRAYRPLLPGEIRVLVLEPGHHGEPLIASLKCTRLYTIKNVGYHPDNKPHLPYDAVSYAWGKQFTLIHDLELRGYGHLKITPALYGALQRFRSADSPCNLWADAVCIDQSSNQERAAQVDMMGLIFGQASKVAVWLGDSVPKSALAFATIKACTSLINSGTIPYGSWYLRPPDTIPRLRTLLTQSPVCDCCKERADLPEVDILEAGFLALGNMLKYAYFSRLWVVQEVVRNRNVELFCGMHHCAWDHFLTCQEGVKVTLTDGNMNRKLLSTLFMMWYHQVYENLREIGIYRNVYTHGYMGDLLLDGLLSFVNRDCYDPHDRIYATCGMYASVATDDLVSDYDIDVVELYKNITTKCLTNHNVGAGKPYASALLAIANAGVSTNGARPAERDSKRPSWVPDYHHLSFQALEKVKHYKSINYRGEHPTRGRGTTYMDCQISPLNSDILQVRGKILGTVATTSHLTWTYPSIDENIPTQWDLRRLIYDYASGVKFLHENGLTGLDSATLQSIFTCKHSDDEFRQDNVVEKHARPTFSALSREDFAELVAEVIEEALEDDERHMFDSDSTYDVLLPFMQGKVTVPDRRIRLSVLACGRERLAAWLPQGSSPDKRDMAVVCVGALQPLILRGRRPDQFVIPPRFTLLGDAWVYGMTQRLASGIIDDGNLDPEYDKGLRWFHLE
jgi:hypothetical protein